MGVWWGRLYRRFEINRGGCCYPGVISGGHVTFRPVCGIIDPGSEIQIDILYAHTCTYDTPFVVLMNTRLFLHSGVPWITAITALIVAQVVGLLQKRTPILWPLTLWYGSRGGAVVWC